MYLSPNGIMSSFIRILFKMQATHWFLIPQNLMIISKFSSLSDHLHYYDSACDFSSHTSCQISDFCLIDENKCHELYAVHSNKINDPAK